jgi:hypothetical protein
MGTGGSFTGGKARPGRDADHSHLLVPRSKMNNNHTSSPFKDLRGVQLDRFTLLACLNSAILTEEEFLNINNYKCLKNKHFLELLFVVGCGLYGNISEVQ